MPRGAAAASPLSSDMGTSTLLMCFFFFQAEDGIRDGTVTGVQTCALPIFVVYLFFIVLIGRLILDWVQALSRDWRPHGVVLVLAEAVYTVTDPPLKALRRIKIGRASCRKGVDLGGRRIIKKKNKESNVDSV